MFKPIVTLSIVAATLLSGHVAVAEEKKPRPSAVDSFVFVPSDENLRQSGMTRAEWNAKMPRSEARWREAWAAAGTKKDNSLFRSIRKDCAPPPDYKSNAKKGG